MIVLDLGATAADISNRTIIFSLRPEIRTRLATIYMVGKFGGAGVMAWLAGVVWSYAGWPGSPRTRRAPRLPRRIADRALPHRSSHRALTPPKSTPAPPEFARAARGRGGATATRRWWPPSCSAAGVNRLFETTTAKSASSCARAAAASCTDLLPTGRGSTAWHCRTSRLRSSSQRSRRRPGRGFASSHGHSTQPIATGLRRMLRTDLVSYHRRIRPRSAAPRTPPPPDPRSFRQRGPGCAPGTFCSKPRSATAAICSSMK